MIIFTSSPTARFSYACEIVLRDLEGEWQITSDLDAFQDYQGPRIYYGQKTSFHGPVIQFERTAGFWEEQMEIAVPKMMELHEMKTLFNNNSDLGFDVFAAAFFMLSRWEEYLPFEADSMGRFNAANSVFANEKSYRKPWVDIWISYFQQLLQQKWPGIKFKTRNYRFISTIDVDSAYAYRFKGAYRTLGGMAQDVYRCDFGNLKRRLDALLGGKDAYDTYDYIDKRLRKYKIENIFFFLLSDFGPHDKNLPHTSEGLCKLIRRSYVHHKVGIHPGVGSHRHLSVLKNEVGRLKYIIQNEVKNSRQHYLKLHFPETFRRLIECEIVDEFSLGFADDAGFRCGTSRPFFWFDLERNEKTKLCVHPFVVMETSLNKYQKLSPDEAIEVIKELNEVVRKTNGDFISLWHNETLSETKEWKGWRRVWEALLEQASEKH